MRSAVERDDGEHEHADDAEEPAVAARPGRPRRRALAVGARRARGRGRAVGPAVLLGPEAQRPVVVAAVAQRGGRPPRARARERSAERLTALGEQEHRGQHEQHAEQRDAEVDDGHAPKSRSIRMSETTSTAKPAIAVVPDASTAAPVER